MKMKIIKLLAVAVLTALPGVAQAQWYMGADAGVNVLQDSDVTNEATGYSGTGSNKTGYALQVHGGYAFKPVGVVTPRLEGEIGYRRNDIKGLTDSDVSGQTSTSSFMVNGILSFLPKRSWHPFVGAGVGMSSINIDWHDSSSTLDDSDFVLAYQGFAGVSYDVAKNWELSAQYRYFATENPEFTAGGNKLKAEYSSHAILAGFTYKFRK